MSTLTLYRQKRNHWPAAVLAIVLLGTSAAFQSAAEDLADAQQIVNNSRLANFYPAMDGRGEVRMEIVDGKNRKRRLQFTMLRRNKESVQNVAVDQQFLVLFSQPSDIKFTTFRVEKHLNVEDDRWLYLPGLDLVKRIAASDERTSFMGSHLFYEDLSGRNTTKDTHALLETTDKHYVVNSKPKVIGAVEFSEYKTWIDKESFLPMKFEYIDDTGKLYRRIETITIKRYGGIPTIATQKVEDLRTGGHTDIQFRFIKYNLDLPDEIFSERSLRNPPRKWFARPKA